MEKGVPWKPEELCGFLCIPSSNVQLFIDVSLEVFMEDTNRFRIIQVAHELFHTRGYRSVTISDIADRLGMSKKTIYLYFSGKEEIAEAVVKRGMGRITQTVDLSDLQSANPLQVLRDTLVQVKEEIVRFGPLFLEDVQKYLPDLWNQIETFRAEKIQFIERLLRRAQEEGLVKGVDPHLAMIIFLETVKTLVRPDTQSRHGYSMMEVLETLIAIFCSGLAESNK